MKKLYFNGESKILKRITELLNRKPETGEGHEDAYYGDYSKEAYVHSQLRSGNPHNVTAVDLGLGDIRDQINALAEAIGTVSYWDSHAHGTLTDHDLEPLQFHTNARILEYH